MDQSSELEARVLAAREDFEAACRAERPTFDRLYAAAVAADYDTVRHIQVEWMNLRRVTDEKMEALNRVQASRDAAQSG